MSINIPERFERTALLLGTDGIERIFASRVAVFGVGGVGGHAAEALARSGVGEIHLIDADTVSVSNINRQAVALSSTVGRDKVDVMMQRIVDINPNAKVVTHKMFYSAENADTIDLSIFDYIIDAIDTVSAKIELICRACELSVPIISSMGAGNKLDPTRFEVTDIYKTSVCPLARVMRAALKKRGVKELKVVFSKEEPVRAIATENGKRAPGSVSFVPSVAGLILAGEVIRDLALSNKNV
jgi:tRNA A37 threonylcarbamoyladenosine dehydratase